MKTRVTRFIRQNLSDILHAAGPILVMALTIILILIADIRTAMNEELILDYQANEPDVTLASELTQISEQL